MGVRIAWRRYTVLGLAFAAMLASWFTAGSVDEWFSTREQRAARALARGEFAAAAAEARDPYVRGHALLRAGEFGAAAAELGRLDTADAALGRGNAWVMLGKYEQAIADYERALALRPDWDDAETNLGIARVRAERVKTEGGDMTGGKLEADDVVITQGEQNDDAGGEETSDEGGDGLGDVELRALWLRRMKTSPADFLKARFAWQLAERQEGPK